jgi:hypothetical protein
MSYRTILVCLNEVERAAVLLQLAGDLAQSQDSHLVALFVIPGLRIYPANGVGMTSELFEAHQEIFKSRSDKAKALFDAEMRKVELSAEWRIVESGSPQVADTVIEHALRRTWWSQAKQSRKQFRCRIRFCRAHCHGKRPTGPAGAL